MKKKIKKRFDYPALIDRVRIIHGLSISTLAKKSKISVTKLKDVLNYKRNLSREEAYLVGLALLLSPVDMERLALLVVYANAKTALFKKHILVKLSRIEKIRGYFSWTDYIKSTMKKKK